MACRHRFLVVGCGGCHSTAQSFLAPWTNPTEHQVNELLRAAGWKVTARCDLCPDCVKKGLPAPPLRS